MDQLARDVADLRGGRVSGPASRSDQGTARHGRAGRASEALGRPERGAKRGKQETQVHRRRTECVLNAARKACKKKGRCFPISTNEKKKERRSISERVMRELRRIPANLGRVGKRKDVPAVEKPPAPETAIDRYAKWMAQHEPDSVALETQRASAATLPVLTQRTSFPPADPQHFDRFSGGTDRSARGADLLELRSLHRRWRIGRGNEKVPPTLAGK